MNQNVTRLILCNEIVLQGDTCLRTTDSWQVLPPIHCYLIGFDTWSTLWNLIHSETTIKIILIQENYMMSTSSITKTFQSWLLKQQTKVESNETIQYEDQMKFRV